MQPISSDSTSKGSPKRLGILGFGHLGQFLYQSLQQEQQQQVNPDYELVFIWNRSREAFRQYNENIDQALIVSTIEEGLERLPDLVVEVAHPDVLEKYAEKILDVADLFIGSPTSLAKASLEKGLRSKTVESGHAIYIGAGAFWGADDIAKMNERKTLRALKVTMKKHPESFKLNEPLHSQLQNQMKEQGSAKGKIIVYSGPVRDLCPLAPNNVNTMAIGAIVASNLGFDGVEGCLIADSSLSDRHVIEIEVTGPRTNIPNHEPLDFYVKTVRNNPAPLGLVTGIGTLMSFFSSLKRANGRTSGIYVV